MVLNCRPCIVITWRACYGPTYTGVSELVGVVTRASGATIEQPRFRTTGVLPARGNSQQSHPTAWLRWNDCSKMQSRILMSLVSAGLKPDSRFPDSCKHHFASWPRYLQFKFSYQLDSQCVARKIRTPPEIPVKVLL